MARGVRALLISMVLFSGYTFAQNDSIDIKNVHYEPVTQDYFADYSHATLIVNYYCSDGWSISNRYSFEVVLIDSVLMLGFDSPETESMRYISYQKKTILSPDRVDTIKNILGRAGLTQTKLGIPSPTAAANTKEVLIVRYASTNIAGGLFYYNAISQDESQEKINAMIEREKKLTSSIGGDYESVMLAMKNYFPELSGLMSDAIKSKK
jgi:hypothetical protein